MRDLWKILAARFMQGLRTASASLPAAPRKEGLHFFPLVSIRTSLPSPSNFVSDQGWDQFRTSSYLHIRPMAQLSVQHAAPVQLRRRVKSRHLVALAATLALLSLLPAPKGCQLSYGAFHLRFTLPALTLLYALARPFLTPLDHAKLIMLPTIAFVWTTPWDNEIVRNGAWTYPPSCVLAKVGYVPVEEYAFVSGACFLSFSLQAPFHTSPRSLCYNRSFKRCCQLCS